MWTLKLVWDPVAPNPARSWLYAKSFEEKQEVILSFCFLFALDVLNSGGHLLLLYYLASVVCLLSVCVYVF